MNNIFNDDRKIRSIINYRVALMMFANIRRGIYTIKTLNFSGVVTLKKLNISDIQTFDIDVASIRGRIKLVAINKEEMIELLDTDQIAKKTVTLDKGKYRLRIIGCDTDVEIKIT